MNILEVLKMQHSMQDHLFHHTDQPAYFHLQTHSFHQLPCLPAFQVFVACNTAQLEKPPTAVLTIK